jgi:hypothetical protein
LSFSRFVALERFRAKWIPVRVKKTRQNKKIERGRDSIQSERALAAQKKKAATRPPFAMMSAINARHE